MLTLAFDTAADVATVALVRDDDAVGERLSKPSRLLAEVDALLQEAGVAQADIDRIVVGVGPGSYTGLRMGLMTARVLALTLGVPVAGVSTLDALAHGAPDAVPVLDARRGEIFARVDGIPLVCAPEELEFPPAAVLVGDGALRYREVFEGRGARIPPDDDPRHVPWAGNHAALAEDFGPASDAEPIYLRVPDAERALET